MLKRFRAKDAVLMRADITTANLPAEALLDSVGNTGHALPFLAVFPGDKPDEPRVIRDITFPATYRKRLFQILDDCPDPRKVETALVR